MTDQAAQIMDMGNALGGLSSHEKIIRDIKTGNYTNTDDVYKCNLFANDMLKNYFGIELPKRGEFPAGIAKGVASERSPDNADSDDWPDNPVSAIYLNNYFKNLSRFKNTGVSKVSPMEGSRLSADGRPVVVTGKGHITLASPHQQWPQIYRASISKAEPERHEIGMKGTPYDFYSLDKDIYSKLRGNMTQELKNALVDFEPNEAILNTFLGSKPEEVSKLMMMDKALDGS